MPIPTPVKLAKLAFLGAAAVFYGAKAEPSNDEIAQGGQEHEPVVNSPSTAFYIPAHLIHPPIPAVYNMPGTSSSSGISAAEINAANVANKETASKPSEKSADTLPDKQEQASVNSEPNVAKSS